MKLILPLLFAVLIASTAFSEERRLNNFVSVVLDEEPANAGQFTFELKSPSWVFVRTTGGSARLNAENAALPAPEAMRYLPAGAHTISLPAPVNRLEVRRIGEIRFAMFQYDPLVYQYGPFDWEFLSRHILPHINCLIGARDLDQSKYAIPWRASGRRWMVEAHAPGLRDRDAQLNGEIVAAEVAKAAGLDREWIDGVMIDEYFPSLSKFFPATIDGLTRLTADPRYRDKLIEPYLANEAEKMADFARQIVQTGQRFGIERYQPEQPTESAAREYFKRNLADYVATYGRSVSDVQRHMLVVLGILAGPPQSSNVNPAVNYAVFKDLELQFLATDPQFDGLAGVMLYTCGYAEEETLRVMGKLLRHYCIEGNTDRLFSDPYELSHVTNPEFADGTRGWTITPAEPDSVATRTHKDLGSKQGRYDTRGGIGDTCLVMTRSERAPNSASQTLRNLTPGRLYALRMYSMNLREYDSGYGNPVFDDVTRVSITLDGVEMIQPRCLDHLYRSIQTTKQMYFNYHVRLFRAKADTAELTISDWSSPTERGGNVGKTTAVNFVEVCPYLED